VVHIVDIHQRAGADAHEAGGRETLIHLVYCVVGRELLIGRVHDHPVPLAHEVYDGLGVDEPDCTFVVVLDR